jgi:glycosyltransferase involved in cell wall biosynthesis
VKILMINNRYPPETLGGAEVVLAGLCRTLAARGHSIHVLAATAMRDRPVDEHHHGVTVRRFNPGGSIFPSPASSACRRLAVQLRAHLLDLRNPAARRALADTLRTVKPDVVHTHNLYGLSRDPWTVAAAAGLPLAHTAHDAYLLSPRHNLHARGALRDPFSILYRLLYRQSMNRVDMLCCPSGDLLERHHVQGFHPRAARVIPNGVEPPSAPAPEPESARQSAPTLRALYLGRLDRHKGVPALIRAARLIAGDERIRLDVAGSGPLEARVRRAALDLPHFMFHAYVTDEAKTRLFQGANVLVLPSTCPESFGLVIAEAFAHGLPVIVTDLGGQAELARESGAGLLVPPNDAQALAGALRSLRDAPERLAALRDRARAAAARYSLASMADAYETVYRELASRRS